MIFLLFSCGNDDSLIDLHYNSFSDLTRSNSYEDKDFLGKIVVSDFFENDDSTGAAQPLLTLDGTHYIFSTSAGSIVSIQSNLVVWSYKLGDNTLAASQIAADKNKNIYVVSTDNMLHSISSTGQKNWDYDLSEFDTVSSYYSDILVNDKGIYFGTEKGSLMKFDFDGKPAWHIKFNSYLTRSFTSDFENNLYLILTQNSYESSDTLIKISYDGKIIDRKGFNTRLIKHPVVNHGKVYLSGLVKVGYQVLSKVFCLDTNLNNVWERELSVTPRYLSASKDSTLFVIGYNSGIGETTSGVFALDNRGKLKWKLYFYATVTCPLLLSEKYLVFVGLTLDGPGLFYMNKSDGKLTKTIALNAEDTTLLKPAVSEDGIILLPCTEKLGIISVDDTPFNKILLY